MLRKYSGAPNPPSNPANAIRKSKSLTAHLQKANKLLLYNYFNKTGLIKNTKRRYLRGLEIMEQAAEGIDIRINFKETGKEVKVDLKDEQIPPTLYHAAFNAGMDFYNIRDRMDIYARIIEFAKKYIKNETTSEATIAAILNLIQKSIPPNKLKEIRIL
ncbi:MAG: hypothetical protein ABIH83_04220 [Candidatus Micrarchaeota archaeon]